MPFYHFLPLVLFLPLMPSIYLGSLSEDTGYAGAESESGPVCLSGQYVCVSQMRSGTERM